MKVISIATLLLLAPVEGKEKRPLTRTFQKEKQPMIANYKKRNPVVTDDRHCNSLLSVQSSSGDHPTVGAGACKALCLFQDDQNEWCFQTTAPALSVGWEWTQNTGDTYFKIGVKPYIQSQIGRAHV